MQAWITSNIAYQLRNNAFDCIMLQSSGFFNSARTSKLM